MLKSLYAKWFWQVWTNSPLSNQFVTGQAIAHRNYFSVLPTRNYHLVHNFARARPHQVDPDIVGRFPSLLRMRNLSRSLRTSNRLMFFEGRGSKRSETTQSGIKILDKFIFQGAHRFQAMLLRRSHLSFLLTRTSREEGSIFFRPRSSTI